MQFARRSRLLALMCSLAVLAFSLISRPFAEMGIADDGPYVLTARQLAATGHVAYNGWVSAMLGWQLYLAEAVIKLFGFSFTNVRMSDVLVSMALAFVLHRILVRVGASELNATIGTLALVLSPLYLMLSNTFMSDVPGLFATVICLYGCIRALQSTSDRGAMGWLCFAVFTNAICGTSRQTAWLGILVIIPSTLWLLRGRRRVLFAGVAATLLGMIFVFACMSWFRHQPYTIPSTDHLLMKGFPAARIFMEFGRFFLNFPFLLLPVFAGFLPALRKSRPRVSLILLGVFVAYIVIALIPDRHAVHVPLEPTFPQNFGFNVHGMYDYPVLHGEQPIVFGKTIQVLLTIISLGGFMGLAASFFPAQARRFSSQSQSGISWKQLCVLLLPFTVAYTLIILPRPATFGLYERYALPLLLVALILLVRWHQEQVQPQLAALRFLLILIMAIFSVAIIHNTFSFYRARLALAAELSHEGVPSTAVDGGWEYNFGVELQHADHINVPEISAYIPVPPPPASNCPMHWYDYTPHIQPMYAVSFDPDTCYGAAPFAPVHYSLWLATRPGTLYVVRAVASPGS